MNAAQVWTFDRLRAKYMQWYFQNGRNGGLTPHQAFTYSAKALFPGLMVFADRRGWFQRGDVCVLSIVEATPAVLSWPSA